MIKLLVFDVDGCLTDGSIIYGSSKDEYKAFNVKDGLAIASWSRLGFKSAIITCIKSAIKISYKSTTRTCFKSTIITCFKSAIT